MNEIKEHKGCPVGPPGREGYPPIDSWRIELFYNGKDFIAICFLDDGRCEHYIQGNTKEEALDKLFEEIKIRIKETQVKDIVEESHHGDKGFLGISVYEDLGSFSGFNVRRYPDGSFGIVSGDLNKSIFDFYEREDSLKEAFDKVMKAIDRRRIELESSFLHYTSKHSIAEYEIKINELIDGRWTAESPKHPIEKVCCDKLGDAVDVLITAIKYKERVNKNISYKNQ